MKNNEMKKNLLTVIAVNIAELAVLYILLRFLFQNGHALLKADQITYSNLPVQLFYHVTIMLLFPLLVIICFKVRPSELGFSRKSLWICGILFAVYITCFFLTDDRSAGMVYRFLYLLLSIGLGEELFFRGWSYMRLKKNGPWLAIFVSGFFFGAGHAISPGVMAGRSIPEIILSALFGLGDVNVSALGGVAAAFLFVIVLEWSGNLLTSILLHALMDFSGFLPDSAGPLVGYVFIILIVVLGVKRRLIDKKPLFKF